MGDGDGRISVGEEGKYPRDPIGAPQHVYNVWASLLEHEYIVL